MTMVGFGTARGVTELEGSEGGDQPAPFKAFTVKVYGVPFESPVTEHVSAAVRQILPPGDDCTR
jgi:hypothetical protein